MRESDVATPALFAAVSCNENQPSLRDFGKRDRPPSVETLGYDRLSLRDPMPVAGIAGERIAAAGPWRKTLCRRS